MGALSNSGKDENGNYTGGKPGDQTGNEWALIPWYSRPWDCVLRHPDTNVRATLSRLAAAAANNNNIGYDQNTRTSYWTELQKVGYDPSRITTPCNDDCSAGVMANVKATGYLLGIPALQNVSITSTHYMKGVLQSAGFQVLTGSAYTSSDAQLVGGDILLNEAHHTAMWTDSNVGEAGFFNGSADTTGSAPAASLSSLGVGTYEYEDYTVGPGDTIFSIAEKFGTTPAMIMFANNLTSTDLQPGTQLKIPIPTNAMEDPAAGTEPITKTHTRGILVHHPVIEAQFFTEQGMLATISTVGLDSTTDFDNDLISITTNRDMSQDCPTFSLNLVWRNNWYYALASNDLIVINMQQPPEPKKTVFIGLIDDIRKVTDFSSGQPQRAVQVTGRGLGKALVTYTVGLVENLSIDTGSGFFADLTSLSGCDSYDAIEITLKDYIGNAVKYDFSDGSSFKDRYQYTGNHHEGEMLTDYTSYTQYNGSLWNFLKELNNSPFNELFWEIENGKATLYHRRTPFNKEDWIELNRFTVQDLDIVSDNTGRSDLETYTIYAVNPKLGTDILVNNYLPLWYPPFANKYGISQLTATTAYQCWGESVSAGAGGGAGGAMNTSMTGQPGQTVVIPEQYGNGGYTVTYYSNSDNSWNWARNSDSGELYYNYWEPSGSQYVNGIATIDGYYLIACTNTYGKVGDKIQFKLSDGTTINTIMADTKDQTTAHGTPANKWGHDDGQNIIEFEVSKSYMKNNAGGNNPGSANWLPELKGKRVVSATNYGSIYDTGGATDTATEITVSNNAAAVASLAVESDTGLGTMYNTSIAMGGKGDTEAIRRFYEELFNWNIKNNIQANGTLVVKGRASYQVGERIITESENLEYYVESVSHSFNCYGTWTTQLGVTRGIEPQNRFTLPWGAAEELSPVALNALIRQTSGETIEWGELDIDLSDEALNASNVIELWDTGSGGNEATSEVEDKVVEFFKGKGMNTAAICGILANINCESSFDINSLGDNGTSYGLCQWHEERWNNLKAYCNENMVSWQSADGQLQFLYDELQKDYSGVLSTLQSVDNTPDGAYKAGFTWCVEFEKPAEKMSKGDQRGRLAKLTYWKKYNS